MIHKAVHNDSNKVPNELTAHSLEELQEMVKYEKWADNEHIYFKVHTCRSCQVEETEERFDYHGVHTGWWCHECYDSDKYPYRKDAYPTIETHGYGERLDNDY